jgi:glutaredoxin 3
MGVTIIYTKPGCPYCAAAKGDMEKRGIGYTEHNVESNPVKLEEMLKLNGGQRRVPTIVTDGKASIGFNGS